jgi:hypothetical protein
MFCRCSHVRSRVESWYGIFFRFICKNTGKWDRFVDKLSIACKDNVPVYKSKPKHYDTPWMDKVPLVTVQNKRKKWKKYIYCKSPQNKELYDEAKEDSSKNVRQAQMRYA